MTSTSKSEKFQYEKKAFKKSRKYAVSDNYNYSYVIIQVKGVIKIDRHNQSNKSNSKSPNTLDGLKGSASI